MIADGMKKKAKTGVWIFGAKGGLATTLMVGARAVSRGLTSATGLLTEREELAALDLVEISDLVFGGHDVRRLPLYENAVQIYRETGSIRYEVLLELKPEIEAMDAWMRPGVVVNCGRPVERIADPGFTRDGPLPDLVARVREEIRAFRDAHGVERVVAVNLASTEPILPLEEAHRDTELVRRAMEEDRKELFRTSLLYAWAALEEGCAFINFTPSNAALIPAVEALGGARGLPYMGNDGKTGETLVKSTLAPMFKYRNLRVLSWQGYNLLGDRDGLVLSDETNKEAKIRSKDHLLSKILGYPLHTHVGIDYVESLKDLKTAWDFIHFKGFMDYKMSMQFIWQGCDAILAAPLVLDMVRLAEFALRKGEGGRMIQLASFFKSPLGVDDHDLHFQFHALLDYVRHHTEAGASEGRNHARSPWNG